MTGFKSKRQMAQEKTSMTQEALTLALEALELCNGAETVEGVVIYTDKEITAIREALAQPEENT